ncbi:MAG: MBL fold metallo-hydrolase [Candidatus Nanohaloarchaea archaeon]
MQLKFLGTGGGRFVTGRQDRRTAGILVETDETSVLIDPGPGALVYANQEDSPEEIEATVVSHAHPDHSNDAEAIIEMMTEAYDNPGTLFANKTVLEGQGELEKAVSEYHKDLCRRVEKLKPEKEHEFKDLKIRSQQMFHSDPHTQGLILETEAKTTGIWTDTEFSEELIEFYKDCDTIVIYCVRPRNQSIKGHTALDEVPEILEDLNASTAIITHFGSKFLNSDMEQQKQWLDQQVDAKIIFAEDGMKFPGDTKLSSYTS